LSRARICRYERSLRPCIAWCSRPRTSAALPDGALAAPARSLQEHPRPVGLRLEAPEVGEVPECAYEHVLAAQPEAGLQRRRLSRRVLLVHVVKREALRLEDSGVLGEERAEVERVVETVRVDEVDGAVRLLEPVEVPDADELVLRSRVEVDAVGVAEAELA